MNWKVSVSLVACCLMLSAVTSEETKNRDKRTIQLVLNGLAGAFGLQVMPKSAAPPPPPPTTKAPPPPPPKPKNMPMAMNPIQSIFALSAPASAQPKPPPPMQAPPPPAPKFFKFGPLRIPLPADMPATTPKAPETSPAPPAQPVPPTETDFPQRFVLPQYGSNEISKYLQGKYLNYGEDSKDFQKFSIEDLERAQNPYFKNAVPEFEFYSPKPKKPTNKNAFDLQGFGEFLGNPKSWGNLPKSYAPPKEEYKFDFGTYDEYFQKKAEPQSAPAPEPVKSDDRQFIEYFQNQQQEQESAEPQEYPEFFAKQQGQQEPQKIDGKQFEYVFVKPEQKSEDVRQYQNLHTSYQDSLEQDQYEPAYYSQEQPQSHGHYEAYHTEQHQPQSSGHYEAYHAKQQPAAVPQQEKYEPKQYLHYPAQPKSGGAKSVVRMHTQDEHVVTYHN